MLGMFTHLLGNSVSCCPYAHEKSFENQNRGIKYISCKKFVVQRLRNHDEQAEVYLLPTIFASVPNCKDSRKNNDGVTSLRRKIRQRMKLNFSGGGGGYFSINLR